ncbi:glycoside hydrolase family 127 protein [Actinomadura rudentiformis]|uniref:Glycoside hydrolase family 127 protein n=1 Tax=Actinomadura rudentiformis TaxID=359158 RepID=A0A6H9Z9Q9_9ACTN|nr:beta-L-arabinofuranosidase domain-containing protein [Actinomadura rudentiformis]KAB2352425.1 glycoside hydrolase family 127 protein [Actinomadura rudentiformis]
MVKGPVVPTRGVLRPLGVDEVRLTPGFWGDRQELNASVILGHCREWMTRTGWIGNFRVAAEGRPPSELNGREFADSEVYKLLEGLAWESARAGKDIGGLEEITGLVAAAQEPDGYLNTRFGPHGPGHRYRDLEWGHELYCYGHLIQAAVARARTHGEDELTGVARRAADHVYREFGPDGRAGVCGHPEIEMALVELSRLTGDDRYLEQARLFVERRGKPALADIEFGRTYFQDDVPVRQARVMRGHAVRALYLASGAVDVAVETGDDELLQAVIAQWERTVAARTYITGGMGSRYSDESFGEDHELPPEHAYSETCAAVASVMLAWRLLLATGEPRYADLAERTLFNVVAASPATDGRAFFYVNTLQQRVLGPPRVEGQWPWGRPPVGRRAPWLAVSCCPANLGRTLASLSAYVATADDDGVQLHQLTSCAIETALSAGRVGLRVETGYPWSGAVTVRVVEAPGGPWRISLRVPAWAGGASVSYGETRQAADPGLVTIERDWRPGEELRLDLPMRPRWSHPDPRIDAVRGCVAVERGPLVYCAESPDARLDSLGVDPATPPAETTAADLGSAVTLTVNARETRPKETPWPYGTEPSPPAGEPEPLTLIPYHLWGNRGPATMRVWLPDIS